MKLKKGDKIRYKKTDGIFQFEYKTDTHYVIGYIGMNVTIQITKERFKKDFEVMK